MSQETITGLLEMPPSYLPMSLHPERGFTLIEIVIVLSITAILSAIAIPRAGWFIDRIEVRGATTEAESMFGLARHLAIARAMQTILDIDPQQRTLSIKAGGRVVAIRDLGAAHGVTISANRTSITYSPIGVGYGAANLTLILSRARAADTIYVSRLGRVRH